MSASRTPIQREPADAVAALPSWSDYLAQQRTRFIPATINPWDSDDQRTSQFDATSALQSYFDRGGKLSYEDWMSSARPYAIASYVSGEDPDYSDSYANQAQQWLSLYSPEFKRGGYSMISPWGRSPSNDTAVRERPDLGDRMIEYRTVNPDGTLGEATVRHRPKSSGIGGFLNTALSIASIVPSPIQPFAQVANAALAATNGRPLNAALSLVGAANSDGLLGSVGDATSGVGTLPTDLGLQPLTPINPVEITLQDLPMPGISAPSIPSPIDLVSGLQSLPAPGYNFSSPNFDMADPGLVNNPITNTPVPGYTTPPGLLDTPLPAVSMTPSPTRAADSQLANEQLGIKGGQNSVAPSTPAVEADPSLIERGVATGRQLLAAGKDTEFYKWVTDPANSLYVKAMMAGGGALLNTVGGESKSGGSSYKDDGYRPTISRGGFQASIPAPGRASGGPGMAAMSGITLPTTGQANDGLWRYAGNQPGGFMPSPAALPTGLISPPPRMAPQTGLISPPAVSYNPRPTGPLPTNLPPMQYGYDDPVVNSGPQLTPEQQRLMSPLLGLLNTNPAPRGWM